MAKLSPIGNSQVVDGNGAPASGWKWYTYVAGSSTSQATYTSSAGTTSQQNPIVLNAFGRSDDPIFLDSGVSYKFVLTNGSDVVQATFDNIEGINDTSVTNDQWAASGLTPTYVSATQFTVTGDQTSDLHVGRRVKIVDSGGTKYGYISVSAYTTLTTVTVDLDSGSLASPLSSLSLGIQTATNPAEPIISDDYPLRSAAGDATKKAKLDLSAVPTETTVTLSVPANDIALANWSTGDVKLTFKSTADAGWVMMDDGTIGSASSGATTRANADTEDLYTLLWNNVSDTYAAVSTGRGASAAADFAANKTIALPKALGRALAVAGAGASLTSRELGQTLGAETHTLTVAEMPAHAHPGSTATAFLDGSGGANGAGGGSGQNTTISLSVASQGGDGAHNNMQPTAFFNVMVKL